MGGRVYEKNVNPKAKERHETSGQPKLSFGKKNSLGR